MNHIVNSMLTIWNFSLFWCILVAFFSSAFFATVVSGSPPDSRPNFVVVLTDDQSPMPWPCAGQYRNARPFGYCGASDVFTPNIDRLAADGVVFSRAYVSSSVCSPSRYALLTGRYAGRCSGPSFMKLHPAGSMTRIENNTEIELDRPNVASLLAQAGYDTGFVGKCHIVEHQLLNDEKRKKQAGLHLFNRDTDPREDQAVNALMKSNHEWWCRRINEYGFNWAGGVYPANLKELRSDHLNVHNVDWTTDAVLEFLNKPRSQPFFLYYATTIPHGPDPWDTRSGNDPYWSSVNGDPGMTGEGYRSDLESESSRYRQEAKEAVETHGKSMDEAWLTWFDASIGRIRDRLESLGQLENTVFILLSDHGSWRHGKTTLYEGGVRVPMLVHWPAGLVGGTQQKGLVQNVDVTPTILELAGVEFPADDPVDGISLAKVLQENKNLKRESLFFELGYARAVVTKRWKYVAIRYNERIQEKISAGKKFGSFQKGEQIDRPYLTRNGHLGFHAARNNPNYFERDQLYDLKADPQERNNLFDKKPKVAERMRGLLSEYLNTFDGRPFGEFTENP